MIKQSALAAFAFITCTATQAAAQASPVQAWSGYALGMSPDEVRAVPSVTWGVLHNSHALNEYWIDSTNTREIAGRPYNAQVFFEGGKALSDIIYAYDDPVSTRAGCEKSYLALLQEMHNTFGAFVPSKAKLIDKLEPNETVKTEDRKAAFGSTYSYRTQKIALSAGEPVTLSYAALAVKPFESGDEINVEMIANEATKICGLTVHIHRTPPAGN
jgi:hypothetical protein